MACSFRTLHLAVLLSAVVLTLAVPSGAQICTRVRIYSSSFETDTGLAGWARGSFGVNGGTADWRGVQSCAARTGSKIFRFGGSTCSGDYGNDSFSFAQPGGTQGIAVPAGATTTRLSFWHRRDFEQDYDGGLLTLSVDGVNYVYVPSTAFSGTFYNGYSHGGCSPAPDVSFFTGFASAFTNTTVDLDAACNLATGTTGGCAGRSVRIAFTVISDCSFTGDGWFLDDVIVSTCI